MTASEVLGVGPNASDEEIRAAWLCKVKEFSPEQSPEEFERVRDAYESLRDPRRRMMQKLFSTEFAAPLATMLADEKSQRNFAGPTLWLNVLKMK